MMLYREINPVDFDPHGVTRMRHRGAIQHLFKMLRWPRATA